MKYCIDWNKEGTLLDKADEINIFYNRVESLDALLTFCNEHKNQRINVCMENLEKSLQENKIKDILDFQKEHSDLILYIRFPMRNEELDIMLNEYQDSKFYFDTKVNDWDRVIGFIEYGVSDIFIVEGLGFELDKIAAIAHEHNIQIRVFPNVAQASWEGLDDLKKFWIRPEDIDFYEPYVDVCEFYGENKKINVLYEVYKKEKKWFGDLKEIIIGLHETLDSRYIVPRFVKKRIRCNRECMKGGNCQMCNHVKDLSKNLEQAGLMVTMEKEEE